MNGEKLPERDAKTQEARQDQKAKVVKKKSVRSIKSINEELEQILEEIRSVNKLNTSKDLNEYLKRVNALKDSLKNPNAKAESGRYQQEPRALRNIQDVYNEIIKAGNVLVDAGYDASDIKDKAMDGKKDYEDSIDSMELAVMKVLISGSKGFVGDTQLIELQQKELERKQGGRQQYAKKKEEIDKFLDKMDEVDIDTYEENDKIISIFKQIDELLNQIETLEKGINNLKEEQANIVKEIKDAEKNHDNQKMEELSKKLENNKKEIAFRKKAIRGRKDRIKQLATTFSKSNILAAKAILQDGEFSTEGYNKLKATVLPDAKAKRDSAARAIADKIGKESGVASAMVGSGNGIISYKDIRKYLPSIGKNSITYDDAIKNMRTIVDDLLVQRNRSANLRQRVDVIDREITAIEGNIKMLQARQPKPEQVNAKAGGTVQQNYFTKNVKTAREYEADGVELEQKYLQMSLRDRFKARRQFAETLYPKNMIGKGIRSWFRAIFNGRDIAYAMSYKHAQKEIAETTMASAFRDTMQVLQNNPNMTIEEAQTEALRHMQKKEMGKTRVNDDEAR